MNQEKVIFINSVRQLNSIEMIGLKAFIEKENSFSSVVKEACLNDFSDLKEFNRMYFGNEFCDFLIPSVNDIKQVLKVCKNSNIEFSLVLPYITENNIQKIDEILIYLSEVNDNSEDKQIEVVCNDWGLVSVINKNFGKLKIVIGRLLDKMSKDARLTSSDYKKLFDKNSMEYLQSTNIYAESYLKFLDKYNVSRVELDCPPQGLRLNSPVKSASDREIQVSLYVPFGFLTTGRMCMMRFLSQEGQNKYSLETDCQRMCQLYNQTMKKMRNCQFGDGGKFVNKDLQLYRKGNTVFYLDDNIKEVIENNSEINRIIYQLTMPM